MGQDYIHKGARVEIRVVGNSIRQILREAVVGIVHVVQRSEFIAIPFKEWWDSMEEARAMLHTTKVCVGRSTNPLSPDEQSLYAYAWNSFGVSNGSVSA